MEATGRRGVIKFFLTNYVFGRKGVRGSAVAQGQGYIEGRIQMEAEPAWKRGGAGAE